MVVAHGLAEAMVSGPWRAEDVAERGRSALGRYRWLDRLASRMVETLGPGSRPSSARVVGFLLDDDDYRRAEDRYTLTLRRRPGSIPPPEMWPASGRPASWPVPTLTTPEALASRLGLGMRELEWLADRQSREARAGVVGDRRYSYRWRPKRSGVPRLIEVPSPRLRDVQRRLLREVLDRVPPHDAAHGFRPGRSVRTYVAPHVGRRVVLKLDLRDFFATITAARVTSLFLAAGYPEPVARLLAGLGTNRSPSAVWDDPASPADGPEARRARQLYRQPHLPQGAPTSPSLANGCCYRLDARLAGLAAAAGASYTRYADDLAFSGDVGFERSVERFQVHAIAVALEEGFDVNTRKTRIMRRSTRQRVAGVVVNDRPNVPRADFDALKATLHNCLTRGPAGQDRAGLPDFRAHLLGRISHVASLNPGRGDRLGAMFDRIAW